MISANFRESVIAVRVVVQVPYTNHLSGTGTEKMMLGSEIGTVKEIEIKLVIQKAEEERTEKRVGAGKKMIMIGTKTERGTGTGIGEDGPNNSESMSQSSC